jgi:hypothetical protein
VQHRAASVPEADPSALSSAQASSSARPQVEVSWAVRCAAVRRPEVCLREACHARNARARQVACPRAELLERQLAEPLAPGVQAQPLEAAAVMAAVPLAQRRAAAVALPSALPVEVAEHAAAEEAAVPHAEVAREVAPHAAGAREEVAGRAVSRRAAAEVAGRAVSRRAAAEEAAQLVLRVAAARLSAAPSAFRPGRVLPWPAPPPAASFARAMQRSQIAPPTARWWQAARGEVWS